MSDFPDFESFDDPPIRLPYKGKVYELQPVDAQLALWIEAAASGAKTPLKKMSDEEQSRRLLGPAYDEMIADQVSAKFFARAQQVAMVELRAGREAAETVWRTGVDPEKIAAALAAKEASTSTELGDEIPEPDSMNGTSSRKRPSKTPKASRSRKSSSSGEASKPTGESSITPDSKTT